MRDEKKTEFKVGLTVFIGILTVLWILGWAKNTSFFSDSTVLNIRFDSVAGLNVGDGVFINGVKKGIVENIQVSGTSILVNVSFQEKVDLRKDAAFSVMMLDLMGGKKIEINPGYSDESLNLSETQTGKFAGDISTTMAALGSVQDELVSIVKDVKVSLNSINEFLTDNEIKDDVKTTIKSIKVLISNVNQLVSENKEKFNTLLLNSNDLVVKTGKFIDSNEPELKATLNNLNKLMYSADSLVTNFNSLAEETKAKKNNIGKILYDDETYSKLRVTIDKLNEMINILNEQLKGDGLNVDVF